MKNTFLKGLKEDTNYTMTEKNSISHKTTMSDVFDMFAFGGAYRNRTDDDCITLFKNALQENEELALKCLFYLRDCREGQGERRFFRVCYKWLAKEYPEIAKRNLPYIAEYGRWDDLIYVAAGTKLEELAFSIIKEQLEWDLTVSAPSLCAKWMPSINTSSAETRQLGIKLRKFLEMSNKDYRKMLAKLRKQINIVERLMSENKWNEIQFDKLPSKAGLKYKDAFARRDLIAEKYKEFAASKDTKVNATVLYPYDIAHEVFNNFWDMTETDRAMLQKYWDNLPNYYGDKEENGLAIVDTSGSMTGRPLEAAVSLGAYIAEKAHGPFANHFITFSDEPDLIRFEGTDITDKFKRAIRANWDGTTDLKAVFDLLLKVAKKEGTAAEDMPQKLYIFSDMEFDGAIEYPKKRSYFARNTKEAEEQINTLLEDIANEWKAVGYELPPIVFWNLQCRQSNIPAMGGRFSYVSGLSPVMIQTILSGKDGYDLMIAKLIDSGRYDVIK